MPDLDIQYARTCDTNYHWHTQVSDYTVSWERLPPSADAQYGWQCTCPSFKFRKGMPCKHIWRAIEDHLRCGWNSSLDPTLKAGPNDECPKCGGPTSTERVAV